jgi:hypothetical protein
LKTRSVIILFPVLLEVVSKPSIRFKVKAGRGIQTQEYI